MRQQLVIKNVVSQIIINKARKVLESNNRPKYMRARDMYKLDVGLSHRLVSKDRKTWLLMTHERYNTYIYNH